MTAEQDMLKVAFVQSDITLENIPANLQHHDTLLAELPAGIHLVVLPEMFTTAFSMNVEQCAEAADGAALRWLTQNATRLQLAILAGLMVKEGERYYNRAYFVYPDGTYKYYDKRHLFSYGSEDAYYTAGTKRLVAHYLGWRICPLICYDLRFPVWSRNRNDYDLLVYLASWPESRKSVWKVLTVARAIENQCYVLAVNRVGSDAAATYSGDSVAVSPKGEVMTSVEPYKESMEVVELSLSILNTFRQKFNVAADADSFTIEL